MLCLLTIIIYQIFWNKNNQPIVDSQMTWEEAMNGLSIDCPNFIKDNQTLVDVMYLGFDRRIHKGQILIDYRLARDVQSVFRTSIHEKFPIQSVIPIAHPAFVKNNRWNDQLSMQANNTTCFNYREITNGTKLSRHALGYAIDINPKYNPYIKGDVVEPKNSRYDTTQPGTLTDRHPLVKAFMLLNWSWGGDWNTLKDYQHFEKNLPQKVLKNVPKTIPWTRRESS